MGVDLGGDGGAGRLHRGQVLFVVLAVLSDVRQQALLVRARCCATSSARAARCSSVFFARTAVVLETSALVAAVSMRAIRISFWRRLIVSAICLSCAPTALK